MKTIAVAATAAALMLGGCGQNSGTVPANRSAEPEPAANAANSLGVNVQAAMIAAPEGARNAALIRAILDAKLDCQHVAKSERVADFRQLPTWRATCENGKNFLVAVQPDGNAIVVNRTDI